MYNSFLRYVVQKLALKAVYILKLILSIHNSILHLIYDHDYMINYHVLMINYHVHMTDYHVLKINYHVFKIDYHVFMINYYVLMTSIINGKREFYLKHHW